MQINRTSSNNSFIAAAKKPLAPLNYAQCILVGGSPVFAIEKDGKPIDVTSLKEKPILIGSEFAAYNWKEKTQPCKITFHNGMVKINPRPFTCRQSAASDICGSLQQIQTRFGEFELALENGPGDVWLKFYEHSTATPFPADSHYAKCLKTFQDKPEIIVEMLDMLMGNFCVIMDRSEPINDTYGKAGMHEVVPHGIIYKVPSNFWLRSYPLMSFVTGMSRIAAMIVALSNDKTPEFDYVNALRRAVPREDIVKAINTRDHKLALENWKKIEPLFQQIANNHTAISLRENNSEKFAYFLKKGYKNWFKKDTRKHWADMNTFAFGWERFLSEKLTIST